MLDGGELNPYAPPRSHAVPIGHDTGGFIPALQKGLLHRRVRLVGPVSCELDYDGKWFRQRVLIDGHLAWFVVSWARIHREIHFRLPAAVDLQQRPVRIEMQFHPISVLTITRFTVWIDGEIAYDEPDADTIGVSR
jgi:hypothetical protein